MTDIIFFVLSWLCAFVYLQIYTFIWYLQFAGTDYQKPMGAPLVFSVYNLTGETYHLWMNVTNEAGLSSLYQRNVRPGSPQPSSGAVPAAMTAIIAVCCGVLFVLAACMMYHCCIKSRAKTLKQSDPLLASQVNQVNQRSMQQPIANKDPYGQSYQPPPQDQSDLDADAMMLGLLNAD